MRSKNIKVMVKCLLLAASLLWLDLFIPDLMAGGMSYVLVVIVSLLARDQRSILLAACLGTSLTLIGYLLSPANDPHWTDLASRGLTIIAIWATAALGSRVQRRDAMLRKMEKRAASEAARDAANQMYRTLFNTSIDGIFFTDIETRFLEANPAALKMLGYRMNELQNMKCQDVTPRRWWRTDVEIVQQQVMEHGFSDEYQKEFRRGDGRVFPASLRIWRVKADCDAGDRLMVVVRDITKANQAEKKMREQAAIIDQIHEAVIICDYEGNGLIIGWNEGAKRLWGYAAEEAIGRHYSFLYGDKEQKNIDGEILNHVPEQGHFEADRIFKRKTGELFPGHLSLSVLRDVTGKPSRIAVIVYDISQSTHAQTALQESERRLAAGARLAKLGYWVASYPDRKFQHVTGEISRILGFKSSEEFINHYPTTLDVVHKLVHPEDQDQLIHDLDEALARKSAAEVTYRVVLDDQSIRHFRGTTEPILDDAGEIIQLRGSVQDVTDEMIAQEALRQSQKMEAIGHLTGGIAHDFNNLLTIILGNLKSLRDAQSRQMLGNKRKPQALAAEADMVEDALSAAEDGANLIDQLLTFSRRQPLRAESVDLNNVVMNFARVLERTLGSNIDLQIDLNKDSLSVRVDPVRLQSALLNLAINSRNAMPEGGQLKLTTSRVERLSGRSASDPEVLLQPYAVISLSDTGVGISAEHLDRVFEPFFTTNDFRKGHGLGLSMVHGFAKQSKGSVEIKSEIGKGTIVHVLLPEEDDASQAIIGNYVQTAIDGPSYAGALGSKKVLFVDDEVRIRRFANRVLGEMGHRVVQASNAEAAFKILESEKGIDLLFTDIKMPGPMNGHKLAEAATQKVPGIKILLTTGFGPAANQGASQKHRFPVLRKPFTRAEFDRAVQDTLQDVGH